MRNRGVVAAGAILLAIMCGLPWTAPASAASTASEGVTATTIHVGIPYVDFSVLGKIGVNINSGNTPDAYNALDCQPERPRRHRRPPHHPVPHRRRPDVARSSRDGLHPAHRG